MGKEYVQSRFMVVELQRAAAPNYCISCRRTEGSGIDFGVSEDWFGAILFCRECVIEAARQFGMVTNDENLELRTKLVEVSTNSATAMVRLKKVADDVASLVANGLSDANSILDTPVEVSGDPEGDPAQGNLFSEPGNGITGEADRQVDGPSSVEGPFGVSTDSSDVFKL